MSSEIPKELIVDASILFSFFNSSSARRDIFKKLLDNECKFISPDFMLTELFNNKLKIMKFAKISESEFAEIFSELDKDVKTFKKGEYEEFISKGEELAPHIKDVAYFALALSKKVAIWSDEEAFKKQSLIDVFNTNQLDKLLN